MDNGTLQLSAAITPSNATNQTVTWSISNGTDQASINSGGLVTAISNGTVTARATANDESGIYGTLVITISNQSQAVPVTGITVTGAGGIATITTYNGTLQLCATITPSNATNQTVTWSISNGAGKASISSTGLVTGIASGIITAVAAANDDSGVFGALDIIIKPIERNFIKVNEGEIKISLDESLIPGKISVYNLQGYSLENILVNTNTCTIDVASFPPGIYIVVLSRSIILWEGKVIIP
jgi:uncharacterized protein YjdB